MTAAGRTSPAGFDSRNAPNLNPMFGRSASRELPHTVELWFDLAYSAMADAAQECP